MKLVKAYVKNGKILADGAMEDGRIIHQVVSIPFEQHEDTNTFTIHGTMEFMEDLTKLLTKSFK